MRNMVIKMTSAIAAVFVCAAVLPATAKVELPEPGRLKGLRSETMVIWRGSLSDALSLAGEEYKPVLVLFSSPDCGYCLKLKTETMTADNVRKLLEYFELVEIDVTQERMTAARYQVRGVPAILILSSDGRVKTGITGFVGPERLAGVLKNVLNPEVARKVEKDFVEVMDLLDALGAGEFPEGAWPNLAAGLGSHDLRERIRDRILQLSPFPGKKLVSLLEHKRLDVRLGALELLEEASGNSFDFDPWLAGGEAGVNDKALADWRKWAGSTNAVAQTQYSALTGAQVRDYLADLLSGDTQKSLRAARMLKQGGTAVLGAIEVFLKENPDLAAGDIGKLRVVKYATLIPSDVAGNAADIAHRLVFGTLNVRLNSLAMLRKMGIRAVPALREFLDDGNPMIREAAIDSLASAGGLRVVGILKDHLAREKDVDVIHTTLRVLGDIKSRKGLKILTGYLSHSREDLVIVALESIARLRSKTVADKLKPCLEDERWRVRAVALETIGKLGLSSLGDEVEKALGDKDEFVRNQAVKALAELQSKTAAGKLKELFAEEDNLKAPVIRAFGRMNLDLPESFIVELKGKGPDILLPILDALEDCGDKGLKLAEKLIDDESLDVSCAAIRFIANRGMKKAHYQALMAEALESGQEERVMAALETMKIYRSSIPRYQLMIWQQEQSEQNEPQAEESNKEIKGVFDAFLAPQGKEGSGTDDETEGMEAAKDEPSGDLEPGEEAQVSKGGGEVELDELLNAFVGPEKGEKKEKDSSISSSTSFGRLLNAIEDMVDSDNDNIRFRASVQLLRLGNLKGLPNLATNLDERTAAERLELAQSMEHCSTPRIIPVLSKLLRDSSERVRSEAAGACLANASKKEFTDALFEAVLDADSKLAPDELYSYKLESSVRSSSARNRIRSWLKKVLKQSGDVAWQNFALIALEIYWRHGDDKLVLKYIDSEDPLQRRAAFHTLGTKDRNSFESRIAKVAEDPSEYVRLVLPKVYSKGRGNWLRYFDRENFESDYYYFPSYGMRAQRGLSPEPEKWIRKLTGDVSPKVRAEAYFCLLTNRKKINLVDFLNTVKSFPDYDVAARRVGQFLTSNYKELGDSFKILLPFVEHSRGSEETLAKVRNHFGVSDQAMAELERALLRPSGFENAEAEFVDQAVASTVESPESIKMVYFTSPGCAECEQVERKYLPQLRNVYPDLEIEKHNIRRISAMRLNEALCARFDVPAGIRLVTPSIFGGGGYLIKDDIKFERLAELASRSASVPLEDWYVLGEEEIADADEAISRRFSELGAGLVILAGMLDGINPCAFATIIFFLSYLQVARRKPGEIAQVGIAFILAIFISYFFLGLGLVELIAKSQTLRGVARALNWIIAAFAFIVMVLSIRDGILCLKGRIRDMTLQLPVVLKERIHNVARAGARHRHFVLAAFVSGIVISLLELACTGQVYAPTILYMLKIGRNTAGALSYLLLYNLAFVVPLCVIFVLAYSGIKSQTLGGFLEKHAAFVKFATAALFLFLAVFLLFGEEITEWTTENRPGSELLAPEEQAVRYHFD